MAIPYQEYVGRSLQNPRNSQIKSTDLPSNVRIEPINLTAEDGAPSFGLLYHRPGERAKVGVHVMHPRTNHTQNYSIVPFATAGYTVLARNSRWPNNDSEMLHEPVLLDLAAGIQKLREMGCEQVVLLGNSGGSALAAMYQAVACTPVGERTTHTPAGDPFDLNAYDLPRADGLVFLGGHAGQGVVLSRCIDGGVIDENNPLLTDPHLDLFSPRNGFETPPTSSHYDPEFLQRYQEAQAARVRRIDGKALELVELGRSFGRAADAQADARFTYLAKTGWFMVIYRTTADPAYVDLNIDPDDRRVFSYLSGRADLENFGEAGLGRLLTPRAWLSTWSANYSRAGTVANLGKVHDPLLVVHYAGDCGTRMSDARDMVERSASADKTLHVVRNADHYGFVYERDGAVGARTWEGANKAVEWVQERFPL